MRLDAAARRADLPRYAETPPSPALAPWVACYWSIAAASTPPVPNRVLPDGCADLIVDLAAGTRPFVVGAMRQAMVVPTAGRVDLFGVRFRPGGALPFLDVPLRELTDRRVPLDALWGGVADTLGDIIAGAASGERVARAERVLRRRLRTRTRDEELASRAIALLRRARGGVSVREVAAALGAGERRLERIFDRAVGLSPKALARVLRFRHVVRLIEDELAERPRHGGGAPRPSGFRGVAGWSSLALDAGYADQPHLIRDFRSLAGVTPSEYAEERRSVGFVQYGEGLGA